MNCDWCGRVYKPQNGNKACPHCGGGNNKNEQRENIGKDLAYHIEKRDKKLKEKAENKYEKFSEFLANNPEFEEKFIKSLNILVVAIGITLSVFVIYSWYWVYLEFK